MILYILFFSVCKVTCGGCFSWRTRCCSDTSTSIFWRQFFSSWRSDWKFSGVNLGIRAIYFDLIRHLTKSGVFQNFSFRKALYQVLRLFVRVYLSAEPRIYFPHLSRCEGYGLEPSLKYDLLGTTCVWARTKSFRLMTICFWRCTLRYRHARPSCLWHQFVIWRVREPVGLYRCKLNLKIKIGQSGPPSRELSR